ncbi:hypothetical protein [Streptomyces sp. 8L]|uniref:hypothetical protein n=1 Tax=Streptomyces sp. 8L TaxID=2877242 RepID=UPI001CD25B8C|nr:hypothetical protein [Streptomyces sp. 8L]MCA1223439.1 hypothetical protein [Streptomyces sp. 8L]
MTADQGAAHADALVARYILRKFHEQTRSNLDSPIPSFRNSVSEAARHLVDCPDLHVSEQDASDGLYGCETGCEYARLEATLGCSHGLSEEYEYGEFGEMADMIRDICAEQERHEDGEAQR